MKIKKQELEATHPPSPQLHPNHVIHNYTDQKNKQNKFKKKKS